MESGKYPDTCSTDNYNTDFLLSNTEKWDTKIEYSQKI